MITVVFILYFIFIIYITVGFFRLKKEKPLDSYEEKVTVVMAVRNEANTSFRGRKRIIAKLASRGYAVGDIEAAIEALVASGEVDFEANFERLLEKEGGGEEAAHRLRYKYGYK
jgi:hypothetical protein